MLPQTTPVETAAWKKLQIDQQFMKGIQLKNLFQEDRERFHRYSVIFGDILFDYSKNLVNAETFTHLFELAEECGSSRVSAVSARSAVLVVAEMALIEPGHRW